MAPVRSNHLILMFVVCLQVSLTASIESQENHRNFSDERWRNDSATELVSIEENIRFHSTDRELRSLCRSEADLRGCTDFPIEVLDCECIRVEGGWVIRSRAHLEAVIHLLDSKTLVHERQHLADLRRSLSNRLARAGSLVIPDERVCRKKAEVMSAPSYLRDVMNEIRVASNRKFRCSKVAH